MARRALTLLCAALIASATVFADGRENPGTREIDVDQLPPEAVVTLQQIDRGGPFPFRRDGVIFQNRERRLPAQENGHYREYTVPTPNVSTRGARRIVAGGQPPVVFYYTEDHYRSFSRIRRDP